MEKLLDWFSDMGNIVTLIAGVFAIIAGVQYYLSDFAQELPTFIKYALGTVMGAGVLVYWLMTSDSTKAVTKSKVRVDENEIAGNR